jgi:hypothetical protein
MLRILLILFVAFVLYTAFRFFLIMGRLVATIFAAMGAGRRVAEQQVRYATEPGTQQNLVKCHGCHLYVLDQDAITVAGRQYCSFEHAKQTTTVS